MTQLAKNPFADTLAELEKSMPAEFTLEVDMHLFEDVGSMERASEISRTMENMKSRAVEMGYNVSTYADHPKRRWLYDFKLRPDAVRPVAAKPVALLNDAPDPTPAV